MANRRTVRVQIGTGKGALIRPTFPDEVDAVLRNQEKVVRYFIEKGFPRDLVERKFSAKLLDENEDRETTADSSVEATYG